MAATHPGLLLNQLAGLGDGSAGEGDQVANDKGHASAALLQDQCFAIQIVQDGVRAARGVIARHRRSFRGINDHGRSTGTQLFRLGVFRASRQ